MSRKLTATSDDIGHAKSAADIQAAESAADLLRWKCVPCGGIERPVEEMIHINYQTHLGHSDKALCVDGSDGMDWVLSGGADGTVRLWHYSSAKYTCYRLANIWEHQGGVKVRSVAFCGKNGPVVYVTNTGMMYVVAVQSDTPRGQIMPDVVTQRRDSHDKTPKGMVDVRVKKPEFGDKDQHHPEYFYKPEVKGTFLIASAGGNKAFFTEVFAEDDRPDEFHPGMQRCGYALTPLKEFLHNEPVTMAVHVPGAIEEGACLATAAGDDIFLWNIKAEQVLKLSEPDTNPISCFHVCRNSVGWIAAGAVDGDHGKLHFWPLVHGTVPSDKEDAAPVASWKINGGMVNVMLDPKGSFAMILRKDKTAEYKALAPSKDDEKSQSYRKVQTGDKSELIRDNSSGNASGKEDFLLELGSHQCQEMCIAFDDEDGWAALMGFEDGTVEKYDVDGDDKGQLSASMRSSSSLETLSPYFLLSISSFQVISFAFGPATSYAESLNKPIRFTRTVAYFDFTLALEIDARDIFLPEIYVVIAVMVTFIVITLTDTPYRIRQHMAFLARQKSYSETGTFSSWMMHTWFNIASAIRSLIRFLILMCSTVLVVPMFKISAKIADCHHGKDGSITLSEDNHIHCYKEQHWNLVKVFGVVVPLYLFVLIPHAAVAGDCSYMTLRFIMSPGLWQDQARRRATVMYNGSLHPYSENIFGNQLVELFTKVFLPCVVILTTSRPLVQTLVVAFVGLCMYLNSLFRPKVVEKSWLRVIQGIQLFTFLSMCCGISTLYFRKSHVSMYFLVAAFVIATIITLRGIYADSGNPAPKPLPRDGSLLEEERLLQSKPSAMERVS